jgi:uncharacterized protein YggE
MEEEIVVYGGYYPNPVGVPSQLSDGKQSIKVQGQGEVSLKPDIAQINLGIISENKDLISAQQENARKSQMVIQSLLALGIPNNKIRTYDYRIDADYDFKDGQQIFRGYKVTHLLEIKLNELEKAGVTVDTAVKNGANYVSRIEFKSSQKQKYYRQALAAAVTDAIEKAEVIAGVLRVQLNRIPYLVSEITGTPSPVFEEQTSFVKGVSTTTFEPGEISIKATVHAEFYY